MKKLIISALLIVFGSVYALAQDTEMAMDVDIDMEEAMVMEEAMATDVDMVMEAAPSVAISGSGRIAVTKASDSDLSTVGWYDVKFASSGVTDGGLEFGASITIDGRQNNGITGDVFGAYIGGADGSWKLQFGDNEEGIAKVNAGGIGLADPDEATSAFATSEMFKDTAAVPAVLGTPIPGTGTPAVEPTGSLAGGDVEVTVGGDGVVSIVTGAVTETFTGERNTWTIRDTKQQLAVRDVRINDEDSDDDTDGYQPNKINIAESNIKEDITFHRTGGMIISYTLTGLTGTNAIHNGKPIYRHKLYLNPTNVDSNGDSDDDPSTMTDTVPDPNDKLFTLNVMDSLGYMAGTAAVPNTRMGGTPAVAATSVAAAVPSNRTAAALTGTIGSVSYSLTSGAGNNRKWSFGTTYDAGVVTVGLGMTGDDVQALGVTSSVSNIDYELIYVRQSGQKRTVNAATTAGAPGLLGVNNWNAYGARVTSSLGSDSTVVVAYSKLNDKNGNKNAMGQLEAMDETKIDVDFSYGLGGGASFYMEYDRLSKTMGSKADTSTNTITAGIKMTF